MKRLLVQLWPELQAYRGVLLFTLVLGAVASLLRALTPPLLNRWMDVVGNVGATHLVWQIPLAITVAWVLSSVARYFHMYWARLLAYRVAAKLRTDIMNKALRLNFTDLQTLDHGSSGLISRMVSDINIVHLELNRVADILREPFALVFGLIYLLIIDWRLVVFVGMFLPIISVVSRNLARSLRKYGRQNQETMEELTLTLKEGLDGARIVQSFNLEDEMRQRFARVTDRFLEQSRRIVVREEASSPVSESLAAMAQAVVLIYVGYEIFADRLTVGDFTGFVFAVGLLLDSAKKMQNAYIKLQQAGVAMARLHELLQVDSSLPESTSPKAFPQNWQEIEYRNVSLAYPGHPPVLRGVNLKVKRGEVVAIVGPSGSGKSTLVNLLERFIDPTAGEVLIGGEPIRELSLKDLRQNIALVTQDVFLFADSIEENIALGNKARDRRDVEVAARLANADGFIRNMPEGYLTRVGERGNRLSGGEKQRISIARAIFKDAPILILDEATSALDSASEAEVQRGLESLLQGRTALVIAHRLSTIMSADRIIVMKDGRIIEAGGHGELLRLKGEYFRFHQLQTGPTA